MQLGWGKPLVFLQKLDQSSNRGGITLSQFAPERPESALIRRPFCPCGQKKLQCLKSAFDFLVGRSAMPPKQDVDEFAEDGTTPLFDVIRIGSLLQKPPNEFRASPGGR